MLNIFRILFPGLGSTILTLFPLLVFIQQRGSHPITGRSRSNVDISGEVGWRRITGYPVLLH